MTHDSRGYTTQPGSDAERSVGDPHDDVRQAYASILEDHLAGIFAATVAGRLLMCNAAFVRILGFESAEHARTYDLRTLYHEPEDLQAILDTVSHLRRIEGQRVQLRKPDGSSVHVIATLVGQFDGDGPLVGVTGYLFDDTARAEAEGELARTERRYAQLFENANDAVFTVDHTLRFTSLNAAGETMMGCSRAESRTLTVTDVVAPADGDRLEALLRKQFGGAPAAVTEIALRTRDGRHRTVEVGTRPLVQDGEIREIQAIARDVSERRLLEAQLRQAQKLEAIGRLAGGIAHDFNNLLTVIVGYSDALITRTDLDESARLQLSEISDAGRRAADLTRQLLAFSRHQILKLETIDLNEVVRGMASMMARLLGEQVDLRYALEPALSKTKADPGQMTQVVLNLVVNARDAMPHGGTVTVETGNVELDADYAASHQGVVPGSYALLAVSDTGVGMDASTAAQVFEPFFTTKAEGRGTGLGLATVYGIVKQTGGHILVYSEPAIGTVFKVYLPVSTEASPSDSPEPPPDGSRPVAGETILLVEDDRGVRELAVRALAAVGYRILSAASPAEALDVAGLPHTIDLMLTDVVMPGLDGMTLARRLRATRPDMRVLFMSGYTNDLMLDLGAIEATEHFISKPFGADGLRRKVREVLSARKNA